ncbi:MAG: cytochrome c biogenesis protein ResB [Planctomycetota bacterium]|jgi:hypothetical protein
MRQLLKILASLRFTVVLLTLAFLLVLAGTLAQVQDGIWTVVDDYFRSAYVSVAFQMFVPREIATVPGAIIIPGGLTLGIALSVNLLAAHTVRFKLTRKRAGIIVTHIGVILLLAGEFVTAMAASEGRMSILEGEIANYTEDLRTSELAVIDTSDADEDLVVVVPQRVLSENQEPVSHPLLPFQVRVDEWMTNSQLARSNGTGRSVGMTGIGAQFEAHRAPKATGVEGANVDMCSAYITLLRNGQPLTQLLVTTYIDQPQPVQVDGEVYLVDLRFEREYKDYEIELIDFRHDKFVGTEIPRNFSSQVRLMDLDAGVDREVLIWMNNPLRYKGETFYQASYRPDNTGTVLQVVRNPGWQLPYISCTVITLGMLMHFGTRLPSRPKGGAS